MLFFYAKKDKAEIQEKTRTKFTSLPGTLLSNLFENYLLQFSQYFSCNLGIFYFPLQKSSEILPNFFFSKKSLNLVKILLN